MKIALPTALISGELGFSLIEALIALAIIAATTGALVETVAADAHVRFVLQQRREALLIAQSAIDRAKGGEAVSAGHSQMPGSGLSWQIDREPYEGSAAPLIASIRLEQLTVTVEDASRHQLARLTTIRIAQ